MGIVCPGGQEVGDRKSRDQMGSGPNASQPNIEKKIKWVQFFSICSNVFQYSILIFNMHVVGQKMKKSNLKNSLDPGHHHLLQHQDQVITKQKVKLLMKLYQC